jgi:hypothetical protein
MISILNLLAFAGRPNLALKVLIKTLYTVGEYSKPLAADKRIAEQNFRQEPKRKGRPSGDVPSFPRDSLKKALKLAEAIESHNAGRPYDRIDLASTLNVSPNSESYRGLITSASRYGITEGGRAADKIALTALGSSIVAPTSEVGVSVSLRQAMLNPPLFNQILTFYDRKMLPRPEILRNSIRKQFGVAAEDADACLNVLMQNIGDFDLTLTVKGNTFLKLDKLGSQVSTGTDIERAEEGEGSTDEELVIVDEPQAGSHVSLQGPKQIFIAHGKNRTPLSQIQRILDQFKVKYMVAVDEPHQGRPISAKVADIMKNCSSAIFIFTADEETKDSAGNMRYRPSDNVVYELGAASALYGNKIVIFKEEGVDFASDFSDIGYISFEKDRLDVKAMDLMKELVAFGLLQVTPA